MTQQHKNGDTSPSRVDLRDTFAAAATEIEVQRACTSAARAEFARLRLTSEEREAVAYFSDYGETPGEASRAATLRSLLARLA
jgi:TorA maturation chaperone TorD